jgi:hypothetical protein
MAILAISASMIALVGVLGLLLIVIGASRPAGHEDELSSFLTLSFRSPDLSNLLTLGGIESPLWTLLALTLLLALLAYLAKEGSVPKWIVGLTAFIALVSALLAMAKDGVDLLDAFRRFRGGARVESTASLQLLHQAEANRRASFPLFFDDSDCTSNKGTELSDDQKKLVSKVLEALAACVEGQTPDQVWLRVVGFASSAQCEGKLQAIDEAANFQVATQRAENVKAFIEGQLPGLRVPAVAFRVESHPWEDFREMARHRPYFELGTEAQEQLNRTVEIQLLKAGSCEPVYRSMWPRDH